MGGRNLILLIVGVSILSAGIGAGVTLLAKTGPAGERGPAGPEGPPGDSADEARYEAGEALERVDDLETSISDVESHLPAYGDAATVDDVFYLEGEIADANGEVLLLDRKMSELCRALDLIC